MPALTFDTLKFARRLKEAGMDPRLAEEQAEALAEVLAAKFDTLVEKRDLAELRQELLREIASLRQEMESANATLRKDMEANLSELRKDNALLRKDMEASDAALRQEMENGFAAVRKEMQLLEQRLIIKLGAMLVVATGVLATLMKLL
jgi:hypothetical protein